MRKILPTLADFEDGEEGLWAKECGWPPEASKNKETDFPLLI